MSRTRQREKVGGHRRGCISAQLQAAYSPCPHLRWASAQVSDVPAHLCVDSCPQTSCMKCASARAVQCQQTRVPGVCASSGGPASCVS
eukprot:2181762-Alexandrium_andersonii.AAC.1